MTTLPRSTSSDTICRRVGRRETPRCELRKSDSFSRELRPWVPKCPSGVDSEWQLLGEPLAQLLSLAAAHSLPHQLPHTSY